MKFQCPAETQNKYMLNTVNYDIAECIRRYTINNPLSLPHFRRYYYFRRTSEFPKKYRSSDSYKLYQNSGFKFSFIRVDRGTNHFTIDNLLLLWVTADESSSREIQKAFGSLDIEFQKIYVFGKFSSFI